MTIISPCGCSHEYQDKKYGRNNRVFNTMVATKKKMRCTVCSKEKDLHGGAISEAPPKKK